MQVNTNIKFPKIIIFFFLITETNLLTKTRIGYAARTASESYCNAMEGLKFIFLCRIFLNSATLKDWKV